MSTPTATEHPHIVRQPGICGGSPTIRGTRISVRHVAVLWKGGDTAEEIVRTYPHLQPSWVYDAISYYLDHKPEIEREIEENQIENVLARFGATMDEKGIVHFPNGKPTDG